MRRRPLIGYFQPHKLLRCNILVFIERDGKYSFLQARTRQRNINKDLREANMPPNRDPANIAELFQDGMIKECGILPKEWRYRGVLEIYNTTMVYRRWYIFTVTDWDGTLYPKVDSRYRKWYTTDMLGKFKMPALLAFPLLMFKMMQQRKLKLCHLMVEFDNGKIDDFVFNTKRIRLRKEVRPIAKPRKRKVPPV